MACAPDKLGAASYWDIRYELDGAHRLRFENFDWYAPFDQLWSTIAQVVEITERHKVLILGIGSSSCIELLYKHGFRDITAIDISPTIIREMQQKYKDYPGVEFYCINMQKMNIFPDKTFTFVFDKGGIDALFCQLDFTTAIQSTLHEIYRIMRNEGVFITVSHAGPQARVPYFRDVEWSVDTLPLQDNVGETLNFYVMRRTLDRKLLETAVKGAEYVRQKVSDKIVGSFDQKMNKRSTFKMPQYKGQLTITSHSDNISKLVRESEEIDKALAAEMVRTLPSQNKAVATLGLLFKKIGDGNTSTGFDKAV